MSMRDEFEATYSRVLPGQKLDRDENGEYVNIAANAAWRVYQAAQAPASGEVELRPLPVNRYGVDRDYFTKKLEILIRDIRDYTPAELARSLGRLAITADSETMREPEFNISDLAGQPKYRDTHPPASQVPEGLIGAANAIKDAYEEGFDDGMQMFRSDFEECWNSSQAKIAYDALLTTPGNADTGEDWVKCHAETAAIALTALEFYADERFKGFGNDPEPIEHHWAQQAISELQELLPPTVQEGGGGK